MNRRKIFSLLPILFLASLTFSSCSGSKKCTINCVQNGTATVSLTLVADTLPANPSILSFKVSILGITLTPTTGTAQTLHPSPSTVDLMRLQSDTAFLGALTNVPAGTYTVQVSLSSPEIAFLNDTGFAITANGKTCAINVVCTATLTATGTPTISSFTFTTTANSQQGIELDFNLKNAISLTNGTLTVNFNPASPNPGVFTAFTLPRTNANLGTNQLELIEDFTGVVSSTSSSAITITSNTRGTLITSITSNPFFDHSPDGSICPTSTSTCVVKGQIASVDAFVKSDGTLELKEFEPLNATKQDFVEGIVYAINSATQQFTIAVTDKVQAATNSLISGLNTGDLLTVNIPIATVHPFFVDSKGLAVPAGTLTNFQGQTSTTAIHPGQTVAVNVNTFVAASGSTLAAVTSDTVTLRWSRFIATAGTSTSQLLNVNTLPSYFTFVSSSQFVVQLFAGTAGTQGVTNFDGIVDGSGIVPNPVSVRALFLEDPGITANPAFFAAKVRQH